MNDLEGQQPLPTRLTLPDLESMPPFPWPLFKAAERGENTVPMLTAGGASAATVVARTSLPQEQVHALLACVCIKLGASNIAEAARLAQLEMTGTPHS